MPIELFVASLVGLVILVTAIVAVISAPRLGIAARFLAALIFAPLALFCMWGFAAAMEPGDFHILWRVLYVTIFVASLAAIGRLVFTKSATP